MDNFIQDKEHPTDPKRSKMKDLYAFLESQQQKMQESGSNELDPKEMKYFMQQLSETYDSPFRNDNTEDNFDAYIAKHAQQVTDLEA